MYARPLISHGFTLVELIVTITIIGIMTGLIVFVPRNVQKQSNAQTQAADIASIARRLETAYTSQEIGSPSYPSTVELLADISGATRTMSKTDPEIFRTPGATSSSTIAASVTTTTNPAGAGTPTISQYIYQPLLASGALCTASPSATPVSNQCVKFRLYYRSVLDNAIYQIKSQHQQ